MSQSQQPKIDPKLVAAAGGDWAGYGEISGQQFIALCQTNKVAFLPAGNSLLFWIQRPDGVAGVYEFQHIASVPAQPAQPSQPQELSADLDKVWEFSQLWPIMKQYGAQYGFDPKVIAGIARQESGFRNWRVHFDGTGFGLFGLDDNGLLPDFERWSGLTVGRGQEHRPVSPNKQIEYAAYQLAAYSRALGDPILAAQAWHRGMGGYQDELGRNYGDLIRAHMTVLAPQFT